MSTSQCRAALELCVSSVQSVRQYRSHVFQSLVTSLVISRFDYGNAALAGVTEDLKQQLQSVLNASARLIFGLSQREHISDTLWFTLAAGLGED